MKTILLPTDFSPNAHNALHFATKLYANQEVQFVFLHSYLIGQQHAEKEMDKEVERALDKYNIKCFNVLESGSLVHGVQEYLKNNIVDSIVMGTQGASGVQEFLFGSNTVHIIDNVDLPVWVIPYDSRFWKFEETIFCADYEDLDYNKVLTYYKDIIVQNSATLKLLHIQTGHSSTEMHENHIKESSEVRAFFKPEVAPLSRCVTSVDVEKGINWYVKKHPETDVITVVNHKRNFLANLFKSNRTHQLAFHTHTPMLVLQDV